MSISYYSKLVALSFCLQATILFKLENIFASNWWIGGFILCIISQCLIFIFWKDTKYLTILNVIFLLIAIMGYTNWNFISQFEKDVDLAISRVENNDMAILTESDIVHLPHVVQKYLRISGQSGKPKIEYFNLEFDGRMRNKNEDWFPMISNQFNFIEHPTRLFIMEAKMKGIPVIGYHRYLDTSASMEIKMLGSIPLVNISGQSLRIAETVTLFNDMCLFAPSTLIDDRIIWQLTSNPLIVLAKFTNQDVTVKAELIFNDKGELINFISNDRIESNLMKPVKFSTPVSNYKQINGRKICSFGQAIWHYPEGPFIYGEFNLKTILYNN